MALVAFSLETMTPRKAVDQISPLVVDASCRYPFLDWPLFGAMRT